LADNGVTLPGKGHMFATPGSTLENGILIAQNFAGYIDARSGRQLAFALFLNNAGPLEQVSDLLEVFEDEALIANAIYELA
jgi:D-alanyl-D-alanine carboxypeptidase/D-alanyl-D-alanine-endopeptidase (penicillin-binding protein 4)